MHHLPFFSILVPTKNRSAFLRRAVRSALNQTFGDFEVVVSDNNSRDGTEAAVSEFNDSRLRCLNTGRDISMVSNWNACYHRAKGRYLLMIGDDDYLLPHCLETLYAAITTHDLPGIAEAKSALYWMHDYFARSWQNTAAVYIGQAGRSEWRPTEEALRAIFRFQVPFSTQTICYSRELLDRFASVHDGPYHDPFPDHYCLTAALLHEPKYLSIQRAVAVLAFGGQSSGALDQSDPSAAEHLWNIPAVGLTPDALPPIPGAFFKNGNLLTLAVIRRTFPELASAYEIDRGAYYSALMSDLVMFEGDSDPVISDKMRRSIMHVTGHIPNEYVSKVRRDVLFLRLRLLLKRLMPQHVQNALKRTHLAPGKAVSVRLPGTVRDVEAAYSHLADLGLV